ncbi:hypothetical protein C8F01DRAFT_1153711 [Mycena amicta]|nr:hypothetical protein C8F01DRAFT_1153711 [Mycena amicta]
MRSATILSLLFAAVGLVHGYKRVSSVTARAPVARDSPPLVVTLPNGDTETEFTTDYLDACANWQPAIDQGLTFDFGSVGVTQPPVAGKAEVQCGWDQDDGTQVDFAKDVAVALGATPV